MLFLPSLLMWETISVDGGSPIVAHIGKDWISPTMTIGNCGWRTVLNKRKMSDNAELAEMMTDCGSFSPDWSRRRDATIKDLRGTIKTLAPNKFDKVLAKKRLGGRRISRSLFRYRLFCASGHNGEKLLRNLRFISSDGWTPKVAAMLLFWQVHPTLASNDDCKIFAFRQQSYGTQFPTKVNVDIGVICFISWDYHDFFTELTSYTGWEMSLTRSRRVERFLTPALLSSP